ncbi:hypothetical protein SmJEL517_g01709 [Synchytrium microbalum]|uniref:Ribosomal protein S2 n=1 Tax=Synchytrium microbalum TaxID=1806994 RepID=A0A507C349_9FUNG|nr:uncharacterized protein SmJEL517_g01709 [Synchytrium microbalum]TPX35940.1 hypothetical protein SmJEL517_g01709 [Synchytrium microbalum]
MHPSSQLRRHLLLILRQQACLHTQIQQQRNIQIPSNAPHISKSLAIPPAYPPDVKARLDSLIPPSYLPTPSSNPPTSENPDLPNITIKHLIASGLHLGHSTDLWHPNMLPYIYGSRLGIHIINLEHTITHLRRAVHVTREIAAAGGKILFVGTRKAIHKITYDAAVSCGGFYTLSWVGGCITNRERVLRRSSNFDPDKVIQPPAVPGVDDMDVSTEGMSGVLGSKRQPVVHVPDLIICLDYPNTFWAVHEANQAHIPVVAICDTDCDPTRVQYPIAGNDDAVSSVEFVAGLLSRAASEGALMRARKSVDRFMAPKGKGSRGGRPGFVGGGGGKSGNYGRKSDAGRQ